MQHDLLHAMGPAKKYPGTYPTQILCLVISSGVRSQGRAKSTKEACQDHAGSALRETRPPFDPNLTSCHGFVGPLLEPFLSRQAIGDLPPGASLRVPWISPSHRGLASWSLPWNSLGLAKASGTGILCPLLVPPWASPRHWELSSWSLPCPVGRRISSRDPGARELTH